MVLREDANAPPFLASKVIPTDTMPDLHNPNDFGFSIATIKIHRDTVQCQYCTNFTLFKFFQVLDAFPRASIVAFTIRAMRKNASIQAHAQ
jgi:hypothetical protein